MVTSTIFFIIFDYILLRKQMQKLRLPIWTIYVLMIVTVSVSRLYISAHFPHQGEYFKLLFQTLKSYIFQLLVHQSNAVFFLFKTVVAGAILGFIVANLVLKYRTKFEHANRSNYILTTVFLFATAMATYFSLNLLGFDANWSVKKAIKFCKHSDWVHLNNSPLFSLMRYTGFLLGFGLGLHSNFFKQIGRLHFTLRMKFTTALISVAVTKLSELIVEPKSNVYLLYLFGFVMSTSLGFIYSAIAPWLSTKFASKLVYRKTSSIENC